MSRSYNWGILATGQISTDFTTGLTYSPDAIRYAVASRSMDKAQAFADKFGFTKAYASYDELIADENVDIVYVGLPNDLHLEWTLKAIEAGKHVLCEKPLGMNYAESKRMVDAARAKGVFFMEAMWTRFFPVIHKVREWITTDKIGKVSLAQLSYRHNNESQWRWQIGAGGGPLLDLGIYTLAFASMIFNGPPKNMASIAEKGDTGVDASEGIVFYYGDNRYALILNSFVGEEYCAARVIGDKGEIYLNDFNHPSCAKLYALNGEELESFCVPHEFSGMQYEGRGVMDCISAGKTEYEYYTLDETLQLARTMDALRKEWGVVFPQDK